MLKKIAGWSSVWFESKKTGSSELIGTASDILGQRQTQQTLIRLLGGGFQPVNGKEAERQDTDCHFNGHRTGQ